MAYPETDVIYIDDKHVYFSPDGIGRVFYDSVQDAIMETGIHQVAIIATSITENHI